jgi:hypothetical protein
MLAVGASQAFVSTVEIPVSATHNFLAALR